MAPKACFLLTVLRAWSRRGGVEPAGARGRRGTFRASGTICWGARSPTRRSMRAGLDVCTSLWDADRGFAHTSPHMVLAGKMNRGPDRSADSIKVGVEW